jgi:hypothetical protein
MSYEVVKDWTTAAGFRAVITMGDLGHHCGYVGVPVGHPLHGCDYSYPCAALVRPSDDEPLGDRSAITLFIAAVDESRMQAPEMVFNVHGSLTYSGGNGKYPVESDLWWFGYDCAHAGDCPSDEYREKQRAKYPDEPFMWSDDCGVFRDAAYCERQCESLARQIVEKTAVQA